MKKSLHPHEVITICKSLLEAAKQQAGLSRDDQLDMLSRMSQLYRQQGDSEKADDYAQLTKSVYELFEGRTDEFSYYLGRRQAWLKESIWPRLEK